jgi:hypothetical protein
MATITWTSTTGGDWSTAANWQGGVVPGSADDAVLSLSTTMTITISTPLRVHSVAFVGTGVQYVVASAGRLEAATDLSLTGVSIEVHGTLVAGGTLTMNMSSLTDSVVMGPTGQMAADQVMINALGNIELAGTTTATTAGVLTTVPTATIDTNGTITHGGTLTLPVSCFTPGTRIATPSGARPIEALEVGDVVRLANGRIAPIIWIGERDVDCRAQARPSEVWPVRIRRGAFGRGLPRRDLVLSPDHAVHWAGTLIPVRYLINGRNVVQEPRDQIRYMHIELANHALLLAEDLPVESYLDTGDRPTFDRTNGVAGIPAMIRDGFGCLPLHVTGGVVESARLMLAGKTSPNKVMLAA